MAQSNVSWYLHESGDKWTKMHVELSNALETGYQRPGCNTVSFKLTIRGRPSSYKVFFDWMVQQNQDTKFVRTIKREVHGEEDTNTKRLQKLKAITNYEEIPCSEFTKSEEECPICLERLSEDEDATNPGIHLAQCGQHHFHLNCLMGCFKEEPGNPNGYLTCPICQTNYGIRFGNMPFGEMLISSRNESLPGHEGYGHYEIRYDFPHGVQGPNHDHPGTNYSGTKRVCYLPQSPEGKRLLKKLEIAFIRRLTFTIGTSVTNGRTDTVVWNGIHHKTKKIGGEANYGYPDKTYFDRVDEELRNKGIDDN